MDSVPHRRGGTNNRIVISTTKPIVGDGVGFSAKKQSPDLSQVTHPLPLSRGEAKAAGSGECKTIFHLGNSIEKFQENDHTFPSNGGVATTNVMSIQPKCQRSVTGWVYLA